jgi:hypothetical protein
VNIDTMFGQLAQQRRYRRYVCEEIRRMDRAGDAFSASSLAESICSRRNVDSAGDRDSIRELAADICCARYGGRRSAA